MAQMEDFIPLLLKWEGGYVNDPADAGGPTKMGVTLKTWQAQGYDKTGDGVIDQEDVKLITKEDAIERILRPHYWNRWRADEIRSQALANILVDWVWGSGKYGITIPQGILGVKQDGIVGEKTLGAVNNYPDPEALFEKIKQMRRAFFHSICLSRPANKRFLKGWLNRLNDFKWIPMVVFLGFFFCGCGSRKTVKTEKRIGTAVHEHRTGQTETEAISLQQERWQRTGNEETHIEKISIVWDSTGVQQWSAVHITRIRTDSAEKHTATRDVKVETTLIEEKVESVLQAEESIEQTSPANSRWSWKAGVVIGGVIIGIMIFGRRFWK